MKSFTTPLIKRIIHSLFNMIAALALCFSIGVQPAAAKAPAAQPEANRLLTECFDGKETRSTYDSHTGKINFVGAAPGKPIHQLSTLAASASAEQAARSYLSDCGSLFGLTNQTDELVLLQEKSASLNRSVLRFQQVHQNIPIFAAELLVQLDASKNVILVNGDILPELMLDTQASVDTNTAQQTALLMVAEKYGFNSDALTVSEPQLWIYDPSLITPEAGPSVLVWRMEVTPVELAPVRELVLVDAQQGTIALNFNQVDTALSRKTYTANNTSTRPGTLVCNQNNPCTGGGNDAVKAHDYAKDTYDFYFNNHARDSLDNAGMTLISTVHYSSGYCNAFWDGEQMTYGDGCSIVVDDVVGHEMTHGVTEFTSGLIYFNESGAINESFSDVWGEFVDLTNGKGTDTAVARWQMGEEVGGGAIRNMKDPTIFGDPDRYNSPNFYTGSGDNGGVHINSGVNNKAAYLMVDGATFNGYTITGIGITKVAKIYYEAQTNILTAGSNYYALYTALNQACTNLLGTSGITADDCVQVNNATLATEMNLSTPPPPPPVNDDFSSPITITSTPYGNSQNTLGATTASSDPALFACFSSPTKKYNTVWYRYTAPASGQLTVDTFGSNYDTVLAIWQGSSPGSLVSLGCNDDTSGRQSVVKILIVAGQTYQIEAAGYSGGGTLEIHANFSIPATVPTIGSPKGNIADTTPTYKWSKIIGATRYRMQVFSGSKLIFKRSVPASSCGSATCSTSPSNVLAYSKYRWRIQAMVDGVWKAYSAYKTFTVVRDLNFKRGLWRGTGTEFYVSLDGRSAHHYSVYINVPACGIYGRKLTYSPTAVITNNFFNRGGPLHFSGRFGSETVNSGRFGLDRYFIRHCGYVSGGPFNVTNTWRNYTQSFSEDQEGLTLTVVEPSLLEAPFFFDLNTVDP